MEIIKGLGSRHMCRLKRKKEMGYGARCGIP
jgi:hypothetical protein